MKKRLSRREMAHSSTPKDIDIVPRRPDFDFSGVNKYWLKDPFTSQFMNALSVVVPHSERTVIDIVRKYGDNISDPKLADDLDALIRQEGRHTLLHLRSNDLLKKCGYRLIGPFERFHKFFVKMIRQIFPPAWELAMPAAFEHFTSAISRDLIINYDFWVGDQSNVAIDFTYWHALEELEHQAVCFDMFVALERRQWLLTLSILFLWMPATIISVYGLQFYFLLKDGILLKPKNWASYLKFIFQSLPMLTRGALKYLSKGFQPWNLQDVQIYNEQKRKMQHIIS